MSLNPLDQILAILEKQPGWQDRLEQHRHLLQCWEKTVEPKMASHTRPLYINRQVLWVATASASWAQNLSLQRYSLLKKLNPQLSEPLLDIRGSSAQWHNSQLLVDSLTDCATISLEYHPSFLANSAQPEKLPPAKTPESALQRWVEQLKARAQTLPLCPQCQAPTPPGELQRWSVCAYCIAQQWASQGKQSQPPSQS